MSSVSSIGSTTTNTGSAATPLPSQTLNQQDFLKLLVAQMTAQDPMNPQSNADFAAQMAQFSALQTSQNTQAEIAQLTNNQQVDQANNLLGRTVSLQTNSGTVTGTVSGVQMNSGTPQLMVNGVPYTMSQLLSIQPTTAAQPAN